VTNSIDDDGKDVSIVKVCMKLHYIVDIPNLGAFIKVKCLPHSVDGAASRKKKFWNSGFLGLSCKLDRSIAIG
jgi:hypothetical protein